AEDIWKRANEQLNQDEFTTQGILERFRVVAVCTTDDPAHSLEHHQHLQAARFSDFLDALRKRHQDFHDCGCRLSDHGLAHCYPETCSEGEAAQTFDKIRSGKSAAPGDAEKFASFLMIFFGHLDAEKGWTKQLHLGSHRNASTRAVKTLGRDTGFDAIGDWPQAEGFGRYLDRLD